MKQKITTFLSSDQKTNIHVVTWMPEEKHIKAVLQMVHGMQEYIERYSEFAEFMTEQGYLVVGHDHLGHGESVACEEDYGFFALDAPSDHVVQDIHTLRTKMQQEYQDVPYFIFGHSMGSYMLRKYLSLHGEGLDGAIICGTGSMPDLTMKFGMFLCKLLTKLHGGHYKSALIRKMSFMGPYRQYDVTGQNIENNWLTKDIEIAGRYFKDPKSSFYFTVNGYLGLMEAVYFDNQKENIDRIPKDLSIFIISGEKDPVGDMGKGVKKVYHQYEAAGIRDITWKLYEDDRHEILNELDRQKVYQDILSWLNVRCSSNS